MKNVVALIILMTLLLAFTSKVEATPPSGIHVEFCRYGLFSRLLGRCMEHKVAPSYAQSSISCRSMEHSTTLTGYEEGWVCQDSNGESFVIPYKAISLRNLSQSNLRIEIIRFHFQFAYAPDLSRSLESKQTYDLIFGEIDQFFNIYFD